MAKGSFIDYVVSDDPNKYPNDGEQGEYYYEKVVNIETEEQTITAGTNPIEVVPSDGKLISKVNINPTPTESKSVTPTTSELTVTPSEGKHLSQVVVGAVEDVTPEVTAQTPVITQIAENLSVTVTTPSGTNKQILQGNNANLLNIKNNAKKEGLYVWKKYANADERDDITAVQQNSGSNPINIKLSSPSIDLSTKDASYFVGMIFDDSSGVLEIKSSTSVTYTLNDGTVSNITFTWNANTQIISLNASWSQVHTFTTRHKKLFSGYVVSDNVSAYPDGAEQGGCWYELFDPTTLIAANIREGVDIWGVIGTVVEGVSGIDYGTFKFTSSYKSNITVSHNLGVTPTHIIAITTQFTVVGNSCCNVIYKGGVNGAIVYSGGWQMYTAGKTTANSNYITFYLSNSYFEPNATYYWIAIA